MFDAMLNRMVRKIKKPEVKCPLPDKHIRRLKEIDKLLDFAEITAPTSDPTIKTLNAEPGTAVIYGLYDTHDVSVARVVFSPGAIITNHTHAQWECWTLVRGEMAVTVDNTRVDAPGRRVFVVEPGVPHSVEAIKETEIIVLTIPASADFPRGPRWATTNGTKTGNS